MSTDKRQTGRTTRLLIEARRLAREGRAVYVVFETRDLCKLTEQMILPEIEDGGPPFRLKFETPETLGNLDWGTMKLRHAHPNCVVLVDHFTIENRFGAMLKEWVRYDG